MLQDTNKGSFLSRDSRPGYNPSVGIYKEASKLLILKLVMLKLVGVSINDHLYSATACKVM